MDVEIVEPEEGETLLICLFVKSDSRSSLAQGIGFLVDNVEYLFREWYPGKELELWNLIKVYSKAISFFSAVYPW